MSRGSTHQWRTALAVAIVATLLTLGFTMTYVSGALQGNFRHIFLPAKVFGVPEQVAAHGYDELFRDDRNAGWDGQFYFYIANDPLALRDTDKHVDANAYRYQRIGLPLMAWTVSRIAGQDWVSPLTYYLTGLAVLFMASLLAAAYLQRSGLSPWWVLFWAAGMGVQITQLHGLPDGTADGLLLIALVSLLSGRVLPYVLAATLAALSREIYVLIPSAIAAASVLLAMRPNQSAAPMQARQHLRALLPGLWPHAVPILATVGWQVFIRARFHVSPSAQAINILDWPFSSILRYMLAPWNGISSPGKIAYAESLGILLFLSILLTAAGALALFIQRQLLGHGDPADSDRTRAVKLGIGLAFAGIVCMYACFGSTVMVSSTGYWKAASIFLLVFPLLAAMQGVQVARWTKRLIIVTFVLFELMFLWHVNASPFNDIEPIHYAKQEPACISGFDAKVKPVSIEMLSANWYQRMTGSNQVIIQSEITNSGHEVFAPFPGKGSVSASARWIDGRDGTVVKDGIKTTLRDALNPGQTVQLPIRIEFPRRAGSYILRLSLVQEGCAWFYQNNPGSGFDISINLR